GNPHLLEKTIKEIWKRLLNILMLPKAREILDDFDEKKTETRLLGFVKAQVQGTQWWQWNISGSLSGKKDSLEWPCGKNALCSATIMVIGSDNNKFLDHHKFCDTCPLRLNRSYKPSESYLTYSIPSSIPTKIIGDSVRFLLHYLARLMYAVYGIKNNAKPDVDQNYIQVLCGVLANQGPEFLSSMRRLFGTAERVEMPLPGLFQTASYMGGTIFLDEIADAPIKIQDNLLGPLEEKKVNRLGWESIKEDVGNIRIIAATHKDLRVLVKQYQSTVDSENPQGFRPDLLSRLILFPPVYPTSITEYFLYEDGDDEKRELYRMEFKSIMIEIFKNKSKDLKFPDDHRRSRFLNDLYNVVDRYIKNTMRMMDFSESQSPEIKRELVGKITMRLFMGIIEEVILAEKQAEHLANTKEKDSENQDQKPGKVAEKRDNEPDFVDIVNSRFKSLKDCINPALLQKDLNLIYDQNSRLIDQTIKNQGNIHSNKQNIFREDLFNVVHKELLDFIGNSGKEPGPSKAGSSFLDARLSDILAVNLPKLLNYIITSEV
ncbi:MAG: sigma 54-interacting transcriptional regulator, partial [Deltaproteobacteria bacterium]|nr:sigma 54-interacting transcriptional regulator [Deltaproteobacteria bacterium]